MNERDLPRLLDEHAAAELLGLSVFSLRRWRSERRGQGPAFVRLGRAIRYSPDDLQSFIEACRVAPDPGVQR